MAGISHVILFDIDGTLMHSGRAGVRGMNAAFLRLYGVTGALDQVTLAGRTDHAIVSDVLRGMGHTPHPNAIRVLREAYLEHLAAEMSGPVQGALVLPGVHDVLTTLEGRNDAVIGLLTGNFARGAEIKLAHFQLWSRFAFGAFGDDHANRRDLVPIAMAHAARAGAAVPASRVVVIGDTPADVDCARAHGARSVGVATGHFTREQLIEAEADLVMDTLEDTGAFLTWLEAV